jgi:hypothetical protein
MRMEVKELKKPILGKHAFVVPEFDECEGLNLNAGSVARRDVKQTLEETPEQYYNELARRMNLCYRHFVSVQDHRNYGCEVGARSASKLMLEPKLINGYDGFSGVHDNMIWLQKDGKLIYTLHNKIIIESVKERLQGEKKLLDSCVRLSCLAITDDNKTLAAGEGDANGNGLSYIWIYDITNKEEPVKINKLVNHHAGIQSLAFVDNGKALISMSNF